MIANLARVLFGKAPALVQLTLTVLITLCFPALALDAGSTAAIAHYGKLPLRFEINEGQTNPQVKFLSRGAGYVLFLTQNEAVLRLRRSEPRAALPQTASSAVQGTDSIVRMQLFGANPPRCVAGLQPLQGRANYFTGNDRSRWRANIPTYSRVRYENVYPGVDVVYYGDQGHLEYDFVVAPGADPRRVALNFEGAETTLTPAGDLMLAVDGGNLLFHKPVVYQELGGRKQRVKGRYRLADHQVQFELGAYDHRRELVIDPALGFSTYLGGTTTEQANAIAVDSAGNAYVTGQTQSADFPTKNPIQTYHTSWDVFVTKLNATGSAVVYSTYLGGSGDDIGYGIALDSGKNAYVVGQTSSNDFPVAGSALRKKCGEIFVSGVPTATCNNGNADAFVSKINAAGSALVYSTFIGGTGFDYATAVAVDSAGQAYVTGNTNSQLPTGDSNNPGFPITTSAYDAALPVPTGAHQTFFVLLNASGSGEVYGTFFGSPTNNSNSDATGVAIDQSGKAYLAGYTAEPDFPTTAGAFQTSCSPVVNGNCVRRGFVAKLDPSLSGAASLVYSTYLGGKQSGNGDKVHGIAVDTTGSAYAAGESQSNDFPVTTGAFQTSCSGNPCEFAFVTKLNTTATGLVYSTMLGSQPLNQGQSANIAFGYGIRLDTSKNAYLTGAVQESNPAAPSFPVVGPIQSYGDTFVSKFNASGSALLFSTHFGGHNQIEQGNALAVDSKGNAYVAGFTAAHDFTVSSTAFQKTSNVGNGSVTGFVYEVSPQAADLSLSNQAPSTVNTGSNLTYVITLTNNGPDPASTVQIKDSTPTGTTFVSVSPTTGTCTAPAVGATGKVACKVGTLANGASATVNLTVQVAASSGSKITDTASATTTTFDPNTKNNTAKAVTSVN
jgi:uncharacterized repeat protein (TIGR01451 family)